MSQRWVQWGCLAAVVLLAAVLRLYDLKDHPAGLFCDEAALGYNAYAIGNYGIDENGRRFPLFVWSFGGYKNPIYIYSAAIPIRLFGLDELTTRLPAALFGIGTVVGLFFLGRAVFGAWVGIFAALFLAVSPWHLHFSRIAFELIAFPFLFVMGCTLLVRYTQGKRTLVPALVCFGLCLYAYAIAALFVPLFLIGFGLLYLPTLLRRWGETILGLLMIAATVAPAAYFYNQNQRAGTSYFSRQTFVDPDKDLRRQATQLFNNYKVFFSESFLFKQGDPLTRHAVRGHGELYRFYMPFLLLGAVAALLRPERASKLILWWLALFPLGASMMAEIPSATRSFIGVPAFCLLTAVGFTIPLWVLGRITRRWPRIAAGLQVAAVAGAAYVFVPEVVRYLRMYFIEYPTYSAPTPGGFQYGNRQAIEYMEGQRASYDLLMLTTTDTNQPYIFGLFYRQADPREWLRTRDPGYLTLDPAEYLRYDIKKRILYGLTESDLRYFSDYDVKHRVTAPGGQVVMLVAEVRARKRYFTNWIGLGLFDNEGAKGVMRDDINTRSLTKDRYPGLYGDVYWTRISQQFTRVDLNAIYAGSDRKHLGNPEWVCAYAATTVRSPAARSAFLELAGSGDQALVWFNGRALTPWATILGEQNFLQPVDLTAGDNLLLVKSCETIGSWFFTARIVDAQGRDIEDLVTLPDFPQEPVLPPPRMKGDISQVVEGFGSIVRFSHTQAPYGDYRGGTESWWLYVRDPDAEVVWFTAPVPRKEVTAVAFTASMGEDPGEADLYLNGKFALSFDTGLAVQNKIWQRGGFQLAFTTKQIVAGNSGVFLLRVPADVVEAAKPLELRVRLARGHSNAWFMIKGYPDTAAHEYLTPERASLVLRGTLAAPVVQ